MKAKRLEDPGNFFIWEIAQKTFFFYKLVFITLKKLGFQKGPGGISPHLPWLKREIFQRSAKQYIKCDFKMKAASHNLKDQMSKKLSKALKNSNFDNTVF